MNFAARFRLENLDAIFIGFAYRISTQLPTGTQAREEIGKKDKAYFYKNGRDLVRNHRL